MIRVFKWGFYGCFSVFGGLILIAAVLGMFGVFDDKPKTAENKPVDIVRAPSESALLANLFKACPSLLALKNENFKVAFHDEAAPYRKKDYGWKKEATIDLDFPDGYYDMFPKELRQNSYRHLWINAGFEGKPGFELPSAIEKWLCDVPYSHIETSPNRPDVNWNVLLPYPPLAALHVAARAR